MLAETQTSTTTVKQSRLQNPLLKAYGGLALGVLCIGFSAIFTKWADVPGPVSAFYRVLIATVVLAIPFALQSARRSAPQEGEAGMHVRVPTSALWITAFAGIFFALDLGFWNTSLFYTSAANSTLLGNTSTLWVSLGALLIFHESLKRRFWLGMVIALVGAAIVVGRDVFLHPNLGFGDLLSIFSSLFYAGYLLTTGRARQHLGTLRFMWLSSLVATVLLFIYVLVMQEQLTDFSANTWLSLLALGLISHALGWMSINYALGHLPAPLTAVTLLSQPVITALLAVPLLGEGISIYQVAGGLLVLLGVYIVNRK
ncbi:MAG TPA: DMT family transporter [Chloroflexia bacterium]|jgi:drug/metabolite transporter (DMT)-like permease